MDVSQPIEEDPNRMKEVIRLRTLVQAREADAEMRQRECEDVSLRVKARLDLKTQLDNQIYRTRSRINGLSRMLAGVGSSDATGDTTGGIKKDRSAGTRVNGGRPRGSGKGNNNAGTAAKGVRKNKGRETSDKPKRRSGRPPTNA